MAVNGKVSLSESQAGSGFRPARGTLSFDH